MESIRVIGINIAGVCNRDAVDIETAVVVKADVTIRRNGSRIGLQVFAACFIEVGFCSRRNVGSRQGTGSTRAAGLATYLDNIPLLHALYSDSRYLVQSEAIVLDIHTYGIICRCGKEDSLGIIQSLAIGCQCSRCEVSL